MSGEARGRARPRPLGTVTRTLQFQQVSHGTRPLTSAHSSCKLLRRYQQNIYHLSLRPCRNGASISLTEVCAISVPYLSLKLTAMLCWTVSHQQKRIKHGERIHAYANSTRNSILTSTSPGNPEIMEDLSVVSINGGKTPYLRDVPRGYGRRLEREAAARRNTESATVDPHSMESSVRFGRSS